MLKTRSAFTYGHTVTSNNKYICLEESSNEVIAEIEEGSYTLDAYVQAVSTAINLVGSQQYTVTIDRATRKITILAPGVFSLLVSSGTRIGLDAFQMMGFIGSDLTLANTYTGDNSSGSIFYPQIWLQKFVDFKDNVKTTQASVNQSASGKVEVVSYGTVRYMECNIMFQTNISQAIGSELQNDPNGVDNLRDFLSYGITKSPMEFIPDVENVNTYTDCLLEKTAESSKGVDFKLKEMYSQNFANYFQSGTLTFRELI